MRSPKHAVMLVAATTTAALAGPQCESQTLVASDPIAFDHYGAWVTIDGDQVAVGAKHNDDLGSQAGKVYFYERVGGIFVEIDQVHGSDSAAGDQFGDAVAVSGLTAVIGAERHAHGGMTDTGAAYVFEKIAGRWTEVIKIIGSDTAAGDMFGDLVDISGDTIVCGAALHDAPVSNGGAVYIFSRQATTWTESQKLVASDAQAGDLLGNSVAIDGNWIIASAEGDDDQGSGSGAVYMFERVAGTFVERQKLYASDAEPNDRLGDEVAIHGTHAIAGTRMRSGSQGAAFIYELTASGWVETAALVAPDGEPGDRFGHAVAINDSWAVVGAYFDEGRFTLAGAAYLWERTSSGWEYVTKMVPNGIQAGDVFGRATSLSGDELISGSPLNTETVSGDGAAYVYTLGQPVGTAYCTATPNASGLPGTLVATGSNRPGDDCLLFEARQLPRSTFGFFLMSASQAFVPLFGGSNGNLCLGAPQLRYSLSVLCSGDSGFMRFRPRFANLPGGTIIQPGQTWNFQLWFRSGSLSNTTPGISVTFQ